MFAQSSAQSLFEKYIFPKVPEVGDLSHKSLEDAGLGNEELRGLKRTDFNDLYDTLLYSRLIEKAIGMNSGISTIVALGSGSGIPTLLAVKHTGREDLRIFAVDIDSEAHDIGSENARSLGLHENFNFYKGTIDEGLRELGPFGPETLIVSNPPYVATPGHLNDSFYVAVNGGVYGDDYLLKILRCDCEKGTSLALLWGSLTSPKMVIPEMYRNFEVRHTEAHRIHFGNYTTTEPLRTHLYRLRENGDVYFESTDDQGEIQYVFGSILRKK
jgi:hypothetical protein